MHFLVGVDPASNTMISFWVFSVFHLDALILQRINNIST